MWQGRTKTQSRGPLSPWRQWLNWFPIVPVVLLAAGMVIDPGPMIDWFELPEQQAQKLFDKQQYEQAATAYSDPERVGVAWFLAGDFKQAASAFARSNTSNSNYNRGNALIMLGKYEEAIEAYDRSLDITPGFEAALNNREIARLRAERLVKEGGNQTGGEMAADDYVFDLNPSKGGENQTTEGGARDSKPLNDSQIQALWLRRVQTRPADFLQARFAYQLAADESREAESE